MESTSVAASPAPTTPRHLKRLSLSTFSSSPLSSASSTPRTPGSARSLAPRDLRLSTSGGGPLYPRDSPTSAPANHSSSSFLDDDLSRVTSVDSWTFPDASSSSTSTVPSLSPTKSRPLRSGSARRTSSISYSSSSPREVGHEGRSSPNTSGHFPILSYSSSSSSSPLASPTLGSRGSGMRDFSGQRSTPSADRVPTGVVVGLDNLVEEEEEAEEEAASTPGMLDVRSRVDSELGDSRSGFGSNLASTITEVNADLLSFIAKKERKCLDLREELKRHEDELVGLKKKWELIVAKSVAAATSSQVGPTPPSTSSPRFSESSRRLFNRASPVIRSTPNTPLPRSSNHALDLSLLSSTFDPITFDTSLKPEAYGSADLEAELGESVQAAKAWMGGVLGKVFEAVGGIDGIPEETSSHNSSRLLGGLEEVSEEREGAIVAAASGLPKSALTASVPSISSNEVDWARSRTRIESAVSSDSASPSSGQFPSDRNFAASESTREGPPMPTPNLGLRDPHTVGAVSPSPSQNSPSNLSTRPPPSRAGSGGDAASHNRRRSTFDILGSAAGGSWNTLNKKWAAASTSEIYKSSRAAALNAVDSFERRLTETLGPLEGSPHTNRTPPGTPVNLANAPIHNSPANVAKDQWNTSAPQSSARRESVKAAGSPKQKPDTSSPDWDWTAFLGDTEGGKGKAQQNLLDLETSLPNTLPSPLSPAPISPTVTPMLGASRFRAYPRTSPSPHPAKETDEWASW